MHLHYFDGFKRNRNESQAPTTYNLILIAVASALIQKLNQQVHEYSMFYDIVKMIFQWAYTLYTPHKSAVHDEWHSFHIINCN